MHKFCPNTSKYLRRVFFYQSLPALMSTRTTIFSWKMVPSVIQQKRHKLGIKKMAYRNSGGQVSHQM